VFLNFFDGERIEEKTVSRIFLRLKPRGAPILKPKSAKNRARFFPTFSLVFSPLSPERSAIADDR